MTKTNFKRNRQPWTKSEDRALARAYRSKTYAEISNLKMFKGNRSTKALRRRMERTNFRLLSA